LERAPVYVGDICDLDGGELRGCVFVEWLMGFPDLWTYPEPTGSDASGMRSCLSRLRSHLWSF